MDTSSTDLDEFVGGLGPGVRITVERVAAAVAGAGVPLDAAIKWHRLTYAVGGDFHHWLCGIDVTRRGVVLQFHFGSLLPDPDGRLAAGASRFLRTLVFADPEAVEAELVAGFVRAAADRLPYFRDNWKAIQAGTLDPA
ncbi:MAG TPA: DUF1801 domain-containing protein [Candidatus Limnocylindrales bacterium]|nr:DUF1801 domain-containing protein [Candidatus Limnocylindrales bacterium]